MTAQAKPSPGMLRMSPAPRFDPQRDGNPFAWIVATAPKVRMQHAQATHEHRMRVRSADQ